MNFKLASVRNLSQTYTLSHSRVFLLFVQLIILPLSTVVIIAWKLSKYGFYSRPYLNTFRTVYAFIFLLSKISFSTLAIISFTLSLNCNATYLANWPILKIKLASIWTIFWKVHDSLTIFRSNKVACAYNGAT